MSCFANGIHKAVYLEVFNFMVRIFSTTVIIQYPSGFVMYIYIYTYIHTHTPIYIYIYIYICIDGSIEGFFY